MEENLTTRRATIFPKQRNILQQLGENIKLARKRRKLTQKDIVERTGLSRTTLLKIERGDAGVSIGHYSLILLVLDLLDDLKNVAADDVLGRKILDIELLSKPAKTEW